MHDVLCVSLVLTSCFTICMFVACWLIKPIHSLHVHTFYSFLFKVVRITTNPTCLYTHKHTLNTVSVRTVRIVSVCLQNDFLILPSTMDDDVFFGTLLCKHRLCESAVEFLLLSEDTVLSLASLPTHHIVQMALIILELFCIWRWDVGLYQCVGVRGGNPDAVSSVGLGALYPLYFCVLYITRCICLCRHAHQMPVVPS